MNLARPPFCHIRGLPSARRARPSRSSIISPEHATYVEVRDRASPRGRRSRPLQECGGRRPLYRADADARRRATRAGKLAAARARIFAAPRVGSRMGSAAVCTLARSGAHDAAARGSWRRAPCASSGTPDGTSVVPAHRYRPGRGARTPPPARTDPQRRQAGERPRARRDRRSVADRVRRGLAPTSRAPRARAARAHRGNASVHGTRANRAHESIRRFAQRLVRSRRHLLRDADRCPPLHGDRFDGVGALPDCPAAGSASRTGGDSARRAQRHRHEASREEGGGSLPDRRGRRSGPAKVSARMGEGRTYRALPARRARRAGSPRDPGGALRP